MFFNCYYYLFENIFLLTREKEVYWFGWLNFIEKLIIMLPPTISCFKQYKTNHSDTSFLASSIYYMLNNYETTFFYEGS